MRLSNLVRGIENVVIAGAKIVAAKAVDAVHAADETKSSLADKLQDMRARRALRQVQKNIDLLNRMEAIAKKEGRSFYAEVGPLPGHEEPKPKVAKTRNQKIVDKMKAQKA